MLTNICLETLGNFQKFEICLEIFCGERLSWIDENRKA